MKNISHKYYYNNLYNLQPYSKTPIYKGFRGCRFAIFEPTTNPQPYNLKKQQL